MQMADKRYDPGFGLLILLRFLLDRESSDKKDKIFGILGLVRDSEETVQVDYRIAIWDLFLCVVQVLVDSLIRRNPRDLGPSPHQSEKEHETLLRVGCLARALEVDLSDLAFRSDTESLLEKGIKNYVPGRWKSARKLGIVKHTLPERCDKCGEGRPSRTRGTLLEFDMLGI